MIETDLSRMFANYYKTERKRSEDCLAEILQIIIDGNGKDAKETINRVVDRMVKHYDR
jgi:hypothetical protein